MHQRTPDLRELHTDAGYGSEDNDLRQAKLGIAAVQTAIRGHLSPAPMRIDRDETGGFQIRCSGGHVVPGQATRSRFKAAFPAEACAGCPFADVCPAQRLARGGRSYYFTEADLLRQARHRRLQELPEERRTLRANVEATMKEFSAPCRNGKLRTRGLCAASRYAFLRAIGINFGRVYRHLQRALSPPRQPATAPWVAISPPPALLGRLRSLFCPVIASSIRQLLPTTARA
jgi:hypothetical protein